MKKLKKKLTKKEPEELQAEQNAEVMIKEADSQALSSDVVATTPHYALAESAMIGSAVATDAVVTAETVATVSGGIGIGTIGLGGLALGGIAAAAGGGSNSGSTTTPTDTTTPDTTIPDTTPTTPSATDTVAPTTTLSSNVIGETVADRGTIALSYINPAGQKVAELSSDESGVTYSIATNSNFELKIENGTTSVYAKAGVILDYETTTSYDIEITTTDTSNNARTQTFTINVTDYTGNYTGTINDDDASGTSEVDTLNGSDGNDDLSGGNGNDTINGGNGSDTYHYDDTLSITADTVIDLSTGVVTDRYGSVDTLISIENIFGSSFADTITGDAGNNILNGWLGNDTINGGDGDDTIIGGDGAWYNYMTDEKLGGDSTDVMTGGNGSDTFKYISESHGYFMYDADLKYENIDTITDFTTNLDGVFAAGEDILDLREFLYQDKTTSGYYVQTEYRANIEGFFGVQEGTGNIWIDRDGGNSNGFVGSYVMNITGQHFTTDDFINLINAGQILV